MYSRCASSSGGGEQQDLLRSSVYSAIAVKAVLCLSKCMPIAMTANWQFASAISVFNSSNVSVNLSFQSVTTRCLICLPPSEYVAMNTFA